MGAQAADKRTVQLDYDLAFPPEKVWRALTQADLLARWLMPNDMVATVGHKFRFQSDPAPGFDGVVHCQVLEVTPPKRLRLTWVGGPLDTVVTWTLTPTATGTKLQVTQEGFPLNNAWAYEGAKYGWQKFLGQQLPHFLEGME
jgi:uncharacterized protein YndB with AHSA1/START domain